MLDPGIAHRRHHHAGSAGQARQDGAGFVQGLFHIAAAPSQALFDLATLRFAQVAYLQQAVDEQAQALMGRHAAGAGMGGAQKP